MSEGTASRGELAVSDDPAMRDELPSGWDEAATQFEGAYHFAEGIRPWNWLELDRGEAEKLWSLLSSFVAYFNARYGERPDRRIPVCWAEHGALVEELTTLAFARWQAFESAHASVGGAQFWHSQTLPAFYTRLEFWLRDDLRTCQLGRHRDHPESGRELDEAWQARTTILQDWEVARRLDLDEAIRPPRTRIPFLDRSQAPVPSDRIRR